MSVTEIRSYLTTDEHNVGSGLHRVGYHVSVLLLKLH